MKNRLKWFFVLALCVLIVRGNGVANAAMLTPTTIEEIAGQWKRGELSQLVGQAVIFEGSLWSVRNSERFGSYAVVGPSKLTFTDYVVCGFGEGKVPEMLSSGEEQQQLVIRGRLSQREAPGGGIFYLENCEVVDVLATQEKPQRTLLSELLKK